MKMLWYKAWLETRWRMMMPLALMLFVLFAGHSKGQLAPGPKSVLAVLPFWWLLLPLLTAGSGIDTETPFRVLKGIHGSTTFILSLPVSRFRLFTARLLFGMITMVGFTVAVCGLAWLVFPELRASTTMQDGAGYIVCALSCGFSILGLATFFATFLDQQIRMLACMAVLLLPRLLESLVNAPNSIDIFRAAGDLSPLITHMMPWVYVFLCFGLGALFLLAALKIVRSREY
jgi:hypothetical protein